MDYNNTDFNIVYFGSCRVCLCKELTMDSVFQTAAGTTTMICQRTTATTDEVDTSITLSEMLKACCSPYVLNIQPNDGLPDKICLRCKTTLLELIKFRELCVQSDRMMRSCADVRPVQSQDDESDIKPNILEVNLLADDVDVKKELDEDILSGSVESMQKNNELREILDDSSDDGGRVANGDDVEEIEDDDEDDEGEEQEDEEEDEEQDDVDDDEVEEGEVPNVNDNLILGGLTDDNEYDIDKDHHDDDDDDDDNGDEEEDDDDGNYEKTNNKTRTNKKTKKKTKKQHICNICGKIFDKAYRLLRHSNVHNAKGKPFECDLCHQRFASESNLLRHSIIHSDMLTENTTTLVKNGGTPKIFKCIECDKIFSKQESLSSHMKTHKGDFMNKEFSCEYCPKKFTKINLLTRHTKIHDEMKIHKCNICYKTFALTGQLIDHVNKHRGIKPHICPICNKGKSINQSI